MQSSRFQNVSHLQKLSLGSSFLVGCKKKVGKKKKNKGTMRGVGPLHQPWLGETSDCGQLPCRVSRPCSMLANKLAPRMLRPVGALMSYEIAW